MTPRVSPESLRAFAKAHRVSAEIFPYRPETRWRPEIELTVQMFPYDPRQGTVDEEARREIVGLRLRLHDIGVGEPRQPPQGKVA